jgi:hypothetical protein
MLPSELFSGDKLFKPESVVLLRAKTYEYECTAVNAENIPFSVFIPHRSFIGFISWNTVLHGQLYLPNGGKGLAGQALDGPELGCQRLGYVKGLVAKDMVVEGMVSRGLMDKGSLPKGWGTKK